MEDGRSPFHQVTRRGMQVLHQGWKKKGKRKKKNYSPGLIVYVTRVPSI